MRSKAKIVIDPIAIYNPKNFLVIIIFILNVFKVEDPAKLNIPNGLIQAQAVIEKNTIINYAFVVEEVVEYFDERNNIGIAIQTLNGLKAYTYSYYNTNELLYVKGKLSFIE